MGSSPSNQQTNNCQTPMECMVKPNIHNPLEQSKQSDGQSIVKKSSISTSSDVSSVVEMRTNNKYQRCNIIKPSSKKEKLALIEFQRNKNKLIKACKQDNKADIQNLVTYAVSKYQKQRKKLQSFMDESMKICIMCEKGDLIQLIAQCGYTAKKVGIQYQGYNLSIKFVQQPSQKNTKKSKQKRCSNKLKFPVNSK